ncbi:MAG: terminase family protein [Chthoniobacteraceae bacterium]
MKIVVLHWSRQIGKSYVLAAWALNRVLKFPGRLVTVLSNSRENGAEFVIKVREACEKLGPVLQSMETEDYSPDLTYENMRHEIRVMFDGKVGRIKVLAANPRTARGFSGDLIMDEFAFHEDSRAIWEAAEPIISSNQDFELRIASTGNGKRNMFYQLCTDGRYKVSRVTRADAHATGDLKIYSSLDGREITPAEARAEALDKRAYDQNYECSFEDENMPLLTTGLINAAERCPWTACDRQAWSFETLGRIRAAEGDIFLGQDFARSRDLSVQVVIEVAGALHRTLGILEMDSMRSPDQQRQLDLIAAMPRFRRAALDMTGNGLGLYEYAAETHGYSIEGVNFAATEPVTDRIQAEGRKAPTARVTEIMATDLLALFEDKTIEIPADPILRDDLRKPEKVVSSGGRVSIAASRDAAGHADRFWAYALAVRAARDNESNVPFLFKSCPRQTERAQRRRERSCGI